MDNDDCFDGIEPLADHLLIDWLSRIRSGERGVEIDGISRCILRDFCLRQMMNIPQSPVTLGWLSDVLSGVMEYQDARDLLGLQPRARNRPANSDLQFDVACWVQVTKERGYKSGEAITLAAACFHRDEKSIGRDCRAMREWVEGMNKSADWESYFLGSRRPLPAPKG
jgi:hypothetical protein